MREITVARGIDALRRLGTRLDDDGDGVEPLDAPQLDDEMRRSRSSARMISSIWLGNTLTPRTIIMSSERPATFSIRRIERAVPGSRRDRSRVR